MAPKLLTTKDYMEDLIKSVNHAKKRVTLMALAVSHDKFTDRLITAAVRASHRGVKVSIAADFSTFAHIHFRPLTFLTSYSKPLRSVTDLDNRCRANGIDINWLGSNGYFLFAGRTHTKLTIVDNIVYTFGGVNLYVDSGKSEDYMFKIFDAKLASDLLREFDRIVTTDALDGRYASHKITTPYGDMLIDGGLIADSLISRRANAITKSAKQIILVTQYCPTGRLAKNIRNTESRVYYNHKNLPDPLTKLLVSFNEKITGLHSDYTKKPYIHAKFLITTQSDGTEIAITGSHNFLGMGSLLGTREIALETKDPQIINQLKNFLESRVA